jgi:lipopolysaccharide transport system permease protein
MQITATRTSTTQGTSLASFATELWQHRQLLWQFSVRNVELRHRGSHLGLIWSVLNPLLMLGLYVFIFGYVFRGKFSTTVPESRSDYALTVFLGLTIFHLIAEVLGTSSAIIVGNPNLVKKVVFPLEILPAANVAASLFHMLISLVLVFAGLMVLGHGLDSRVIWLPVIILPVVLLALGASWLFAAVGVFFRDIGQIVGFVSMALMFGSAVFYPVSSIPPSAWQILRFNPVLLAIELARNTVMWNHPINLQHYTYLALTSVCFCAFGYWTFKKLKPAFADVL